MFSLIGLSVELLRWKHSAFGFWTFILSCRVLEWILLWVMDYLMYTKSWCDSTSAEISEIRLGTGHKSGGRLYFGNPGVHISTVGLELYTRDRILIFIWLLIETLDFLSEAFPYIVHETNVGLRRLKICTPVAVSVHSTEYIHSMTPSISETYPVFFPLSPDF